MTYEVIIIDDEIKAIEGLEVLINYTGLPVKVVAKATNAIEGIKNMKQTDPMIVFLDIEMPLLDGFDFLNVVNKTNKYFIFVTAHETYALKAIKNNINDYLLKPVSLTDLKISLEKAVDSLKKTRANHLNTKIAIPSSKGTLFKYLSEIVYIKAKNRYSEIICIDGSSYLVCKNLGEYENELKNKKFYRVHKSFLVNCEHVKSIINMDGGFIELAGNHQIEISQRKKGDFLRYMHD